MLTSAHPGLALDSSSYCTGWSRFGGSREVVASQVWALLFSLFLFRLSYSIPTRAMASPSNLERFVCSLASILILIQVRAATFLQALSPDSSLRASPGLHRLRSLFSRSHYYFSAFLFLVEMTLLENMLFF